MAEGYALEKSVWTEDDFDRMGWHDARVHALAFLPESWEFVLDLDYILEWLAPRPGEEHYRFRTAPATLVFENVTDLRIELEPFSDVSLDRVTRAEPGVPPNAEYIGKSLDWMWTLDFHVGEITFRGTGYRQYLRRPPSLDSTQWLTLEARGGISFDRRVPPDGAI